MIFLGNQAVGINPPGNQVLEAELIEGTISGAYVNSFVTKVEISSLRRKNFTSLEFPNCTSIYDSSIRDNPNLESVKLPKCSMVGANYALGDNPKLSVIALPAITSSLRMAFYRDTLLTTADIGPGISGNGLDHQAFVDTSLNLLILRKSDEPVKLNNVNAFQSTPFASGGVGGTIYIPQALYNHLGDGTSLDYKAATNWSTVDGYGTITWAKIEGSQYEDYYADGTPVEVTANG